MAIYFYFYNRQTGELVDVWCHTESSAGVEVGESGIRYFVEAAIGLCEDNQNVRLEISTRNRF